MIEIVKKWAGYLFKSWYRNHYLGFQPALTHKNGDCVYCYKCGNMANGWVRKYWIFNVPICRPHYDGTK